MKLKKTLVLPIGSIFLAVALLMERFIPSTHSSNFFIGFFIGLSIVLNIYYLLVFSKANKKEVQQ